MKRYVLRCERNWILESESDKEEDWLVVAALGDVLEKVLIDFGKLFRRIGAVRLYERLDILREEVVDGRSRVRWERNYILESESVKEEPWLVVVELGSMLDKILIDIGKLIHTIGAIWLNERLDILWEDVDERNRVRWLEEQSRRFNIYKFSEIANYWEGQK